MDITPAIFSAITAIVSVPFFMALMRRIGPLRHEPGPGKSFAELQREYGRWEVLSIPLSLTFVSLLSLMLWSVLRMTYHDYLARFDASILVVALPDILWLSPALFFALFLSALPFHFLYLALLGRRRYAEYIEYTNQKFRLNTWRLFRYLGNLLLPLCLVLTLLALDCYLRVSADALIVNRYLGLGEKSYAFASVRQIRLIRPAAAGVDGGGPGAHYVFEFASGERYSFRDSLGEVPLARQRQVAARVARAAGIDIAIEEAPR